MMNEQLFFDIGRQRHSDDVARAERAIARRATLGVEASTTRDRAELGLISLATKLQPALSIQVQRSAETAAA